MKFKLLREGLNPCRGTEHSAGIDLRLASVVYNDHGLYWLRLGVAVEIPENHLGMLAVRSSIGAKGLTMTNGVGIIDSDYRDELMMKCTFQHRGHDFPDIGERIAQLIIIPYIRTEIEIVDELTKGERNGGFGSTGRV